jgi:hypothetical protein
MKMARSRILEQSSILFALWPWILAASTNALTVEHDEPAEYEGNNPQKRNYSAVEEADAIFQILRDLAGKEIFGV